MARRSVGCEVTGVLLALLLVSACGEAPHHRDFTKAGQDHVLAFETDTADECWSPWLTRAGARTGLGALYVGPRDEYVPLVRTSISAIGEVPLGVVVSCWVHTDARNGRMRWMVRTAPARMPAQRFYSRIIRPGEIPAGRWCEVHARIPLEQLHVGPLDRIEVLLWNEGGTAMTMDDAQVTFSASDLHGSTPGTPFDVDSLVDGRMPDGRAPDPRYASPLNDSVR